MKKGYLLQPQKLVERSFRRSNHYLRIATRYDKMAERLTSFLCLVGSIVCMP